MCSPAATSSASGCASTRGFRQNLLYRLGRDRQAASWRAPPARSSASRSSSGATMPPSCWMMWTRRRSHRSCSSPRSSTAARSAWRSSGSTRTRESTGHCARRSRRKRAKRGSVAGLMPSTQLGPIQNKEQYERVSEHSRGHSRARCAHSGGRRAARWARLLLPTDDRRRYRRAQSPGAGGAVRPHRSDP